MKKILTGLFIVLCISVPITSAAKEVHDVGDDILQQIAYHNIVLKFLLKEYDNKVGEEYSRRSYLINMELKLLGKAFQTDEMQMRLLERYDDQHRRLDHCMAKYRPMIGVIKRTIHCNRSLMSSLTNDFMKYGRLDFDPTCVAENPWL